MILYVSISIMLNLSVKDNVSLMLFIQALYAIQTVMDRGIVLKRGLANRDFRWLGNCISSIKSEAIFVN